MERLIIITWLVALSANWVWGQAQPRGYFDRESARFGDTVRYVLTFRHPPEMEVLMPDSSFDFSPFEYGNHQFFPTQTDSTGSLDSVIYTLWTFDIAPVNVFALPVTIWKNGENQPRYPKPDTLYLEEVIKQMPDTLALKARNHITTLELTLNTGQIILVSTAIVCILGIVILLFGEKIWIFIQNNRLKNQKLKFILKMDQLLESTLAKEDLIELVSYWKAESGKLHELPLSSYTTRELSATLNDEEVTTALRATDRVLYAGLGNEPDLKAKLTKLKDYTVDLYERKIKEVRNG